jgi:hypothetical protein
MTIYDDLPASHEIQRSFARTMTHARASAEVRDHLDEEKHGTFQLAGKLLPTTRQQQLAREDRTEYGKRGGLYAM